MGGLTIALQAAEHDDGLALVLDVQAGGFGAAHEGYQLLIDDLDHLLGGGQAVEHLDADGALGHGLDKVLDDLVAHVRFKQRQTHLAHCELDVLFAQAALAAQVLECGIEFFAESFKSHGTVTP